MTTVANQQVGRIFNSQMIPLRQEDIEKLPTNQQRVIKATLIRQINNEADPKKIQRNQEELKTLLFDTSNISPLNLLLENRLKQRKFNLDIKKTRSKSKNDKFILAEKSEQTERETDKSFRKTDYLNPIDVSNEVVENYKDALSKLQNVAIDRDHLKNLDFLNGIITPKVYVPSNKLPSLHKIKTMSRRNKDKFKERQKFMNAEGDPSSIAKHSPITQKILQEENSQQNIDTSILTWLKANQQKYELYKKRKKVDKEKNPIKMYFNDEPVRTESENILNDDDFMLEAKIKLLGEKARQELESLMHQGLEIKPMGFHEKIKKYRTSIPQKVKKAKAGQGRAEDQSPNMQDLTFDAIDAKEDLNLTEGDENIREALNLSQVNAINARQGSADIKKRPMALPSIQQMYSVAIRNKKILQSKSYYLNTINGEDDILIRNELIENADKEKNEGIAQAGARQRANFSIATSATSSYKIVNDARKATESTKNGGMTPAISTSTSSTNPPQQPPSNQVQQQAANQAPATQAASSSNRQVIVRKKTVLAQKTVGQTNSDKAISHKDYIFQQKYISFRDFSAQINFSNNIICQQTQARPAPIYRYYIGKGNNSHLLKMAMKQRWWWLQGESVEDENLNFLWTQLKKHEFISTMKPHAAVENQEHISENGTVQSERLTEANDDNSDSDLENSFSKGRLNRTSVKRKTSSPGPGRFSEKITAINSSPVIKKIEMSSSSSSSEKEKYLRSILSAGDIGLLKNFPFQQGDKKKPNKDLLYSAEEIEANIRLIKKNVLTLSCPQPALKIHNHLELNYHLGSKKALYYNMRAYFEAQKENVFNYLPLTFHIQNGLQDEEYSKFLDFYNKYNEEVAEIEKQYADEEDPDKKKAIKIKKNIWIIKPGELTNRGKGITICNDLSSINAVLNSKEMHPNGKAKTYILQLYIDRPFLFNKRKFDIRCYMMITIINGLMKGYWYREGYIRTSSKEFSVKNINNRMIHLTNDAVQKKGDDYGKFENANKLSFNDFQKYLDANYPECKYNFMAEIHPKLKFLAQSSIRAVYGKIDQQRKDHSFEVFGLDFMIDENFTPWLIEINSNPCLELSSPLLARIIPTMIDNALRIALDPIFQPPGWPSSKKHMIPDNVIEGNKFEIIFDEVQDGPALVALNQGETQGAQLDKLHEIEEEEERELSDCEDKC